MKIALLTFINTNNYGATLQGYATTRFLQQYGHEVVIINIPLLNPGRGKKISYVQKIINKLLAYYIKFIMLFNQRKKDEYLEKQRVIKDEKIIQAAKAFDKINMTYFDEFRVTYLPNITIKKYFYDKDFDDDFTDVDLFIVGSDQVWNPWVTNDQVGLFFFSFLNNAEKRISYAPSFGGSIKWSYSNDKTKYIKTLLNKFDGISIRDGESKYILENIFKVKGQEVLDPTFLLDNYDELLEKSNVNAKGSMFCFKFIINDYWANTIKFMANELNLEIRMDSCLIPFEGLPFKPQCTVIDWLGLIKTSDFVFTDSFHGMVFCILFRKQFVVTPSYANGEGRYKDLAFKLGLEDRLYFTTKEIHQNKNIWMKHIDYDKVYERLQKLRTDSKAFLLSFLN